MSGAALLAELAAAGIHVTLEGDNLRVRGDAGVRLAPHTERLREHKPALLVALREREASEQHGPQVEGNRLTPDETAALGLDPALGQAHVAHRPVEATKPPGDWDGVVSAGCGAPLCCKILGPCGHFVRHGRCWAEASS